MKLKLVLLPVLLFAAAACEPAEDIEPLACRNEIAGEALVGTGDLGSGFQFLTAGDDVPVMLGPQGMHMVIVSVRVSNLEMPGAGVGNVRVSIALVHEGEVVGGTVGEIKPGRVQGGETDFLGLRAIITADEVHKLTEGLAQLDVVVYDGCGREIKAATAAQLYE